jgi:hypothetical protein
MFKADGTPVRHDALSFWVGQGPTNDADGDGLLDRYEALHACLADTAASDDPDGDRLSSSQEHAAGTDPCNSDTDEGGENDGSEVARGGNPIAPRDDLLPTPGWFSLVTRINEHLEVDPRYVPQPFANLLRVPSADAYALLLIERRETAGATSLPWMERARIDPRTLGGVWLDANLPAGLTFEYRMRGIDAAGNESALSPTLAATVKQDPLAPIGALRILHGPRTDDPVVNLAVDLYGDAPGEIEMQVGNPRERLAYQAYRAITSVDAITPEAPTPMLIAAKLRDASGNESQVYSDEIVVYPRGALGDVRARVERVGGGGDAAIFVRLAGLGDGPVATSGEDGVVVLPDLLPGTYTVEFIEQDGKVGALKMDVVVEAGEETDLGVVAVPEPSALAAALAVWASLWMQKRRQIVGRRPRG